jgi:hypothetical protein
VTLSHRGYIEDLRILNPNVRMQSVVPDVGCCCVSVAVPGARFVVEPATTSRL